MLNAFGNVKFHINYHISNHNHADKIKIDKIKF